MATISPLHPLEAGFVFCLKTTWISQSPWINEFRAHFPCVGEVGGTY